MLLTLIKYIENLNKKILFDNFKKTFIESTKFDNEKETKITRQIIKAHEAEKEEEKKEEDREWY